MYIVLLLCDSSKGQLLGEYRDSAHTPKLMVLKISLDPTQITLYSQMGECVLRWLC